MSTVSTKFDSSRSLLKTILVFLLIWIICNHSVKHLARTVGPGGGGDLASFGTNVPGTIIGGVDDFRRYLGAFVGSFQSSCPESVSKPCSKTLDAIKIVLGLD